MRTPVLSEVPYELSTDAHSKECKRSPQQFIPAGFPLHDQPPTGTEDSASPLTIPDASSGPWLNLHYALAAACPNCYARLHGRTKKVDYSTKKTYTIFVCSKIRMIENNKAETT